MSWPTTPGKTTLSAVTVESVQEKISKSSGKPYYIVGLDGYPGTCVCFSEVFAGEVCDLECETKEGGNGIEHVLKKPWKGGARGGGGVAKSDPAKNQTIKEANERNNAGIKTANTLNNAKDIVGMAVALLGPKSDTNQVAVVANDLAELVLTLQKRLIDEAA